ncbi:hypothetical protein WICPIJ_004308 [Wickerhamomyces pijperi]|uniref:Uncharacterized protein n=1 Tax=Wickerhamomyces pijperi TaxID=599730 RepID=A0A9P8Q5L0_WICPI|nr:hypothetical protein WICPIJ_004308 [Wickerhamomyces pijperi]
MLMTWFTDSLKLCTARLSLPLLKVSKAELIKFSVADSEVSSMAALSDNAAPIKIQYLEPGSSAFKKSTKSEGSSISSKSKVTNSGAVGSESSYS